MRISKQESANTETSFTKAPSVSDKLLNDQLLSCVLHLQLPVTTIFKYIQTPVFQFFIPKDLL